MENINTNILKIILGKHKKNEELKEEKNKEKNEDKDEFIQNIIKTNIALIKILCHKIFQKNMDYL